MADNKASAAKIRDLLPHKSSPGDRVLFPQTEISSELFERVRSQKAKDKVTWEEILTACFTRYLQESKEIAWLPKK